MLVRDYNRPVDLIPDRLLLMMMMTMMRSKTMQTFKRDSIEICFTSQTVVKIQNIK